MSRRIASIARRVVVVAGEVVAHEVERRLHLLAHGREDELVAPDGVPAELALVRLDPLGEEPPTPLRGPQRGGDRGAVAGPEGARSSASSRTSFFIRHSASIESQLRSDAEFWSRPSSASSTPPRVRSMTARRLSVADSWAKLSIQWIFQWRSWMSIASSRTHGELGERHPVRGVEPGLEVGEVPLHLGHEAVPPPVGEVRAVHGQDGVEVGAPSTPRTTRPGAPGRRSGRCTRCRRSAGRDRPGSRSCRRSR